MVHRPQLRITARLVMGMLLAVARCCHTLVEQPRSSLMPFFPLFKAMEEVLKLKGLCWFSTNLRHTQFQNLWDNIIETYFLTGNPFVMVQWNSWPLWLINPAEIVRIRLETNRHFPHWHMQFDRFNHVMLDYKCNGDTASVSGSSRSELDGKLWTLDS